MAANFFKCLLPFLLLIIHLGHFLVGTEETKCIVCHKRLDKKLETTRKNLPQRHDLEACFGVSYDDPGILCSGCRRAVYRYKKTGKTFFHVSIFIVVQLNIIL